MLSSADMRSDVQQHTKQCTSTREPIVAVQKIHAWCTRVRE